MQPAVEIRIEPHVRDAIARIERGEKTADIAKSIGVTPFRLRAAIDRLIAAERESILTEADLRDLLAGVEPGIIAASKGVGPVMFADAVQRNATRMGLYGPPPVVVAFLDEHAHRMTRTLVARRLRVTLARLARWTEDYGWEWKYHGGRQRWTTAA